MDMVAVVGGLGVDGRLREGLEGHGALGTQGFQHRIETLPRPLQQAAEPIDGDSVRRRPQAVVGSPELPPQALRVEESGELLVLVEPIP
jgi:hypothetical protein